MREAVRQRYAAAAVQVTGGGAVCGGPAAIEIDDNFGSGCYTGAEHQGLPAAAVATSLGCGSPTAVADLHQGGGRIGISDVVADELTTAQRARAVTASAASPGPLRPRRQSAAASPPAAPPPSSPPSPR